ncbi:hypothetical protein ABZW03_07015 [Kitasatospora sp. NPDC004799]|uniref:hypothetical protein n=1 Tax=Kitasatospora sp. NPDC004799 TaxID=3154460 RepID=UPI0033BDDB81
MLGWYGTSGERFAEQQVPYLASSTIPGAALIVSGTLLVALRPPPSPPGRADLTDRRVERLYDLLVEPDAGPPGRSLPSDAPDRSGRADDAGWLAVPEGTRYHRPDCPLVVGKERAGPVDAGAVRAQGLTPCPLCSPPTVDPGPTRPGESAPPDAG